MANVLKHRFVSGKTDGPDTSQIQPSNWNDGHAFTGGNAGDVLTRDPSDATYGATWGPSGAPIVGSTDTTVLTLPGGHTEYFINFNAGAGLTVHGVAASSGTFPIGARISMYQTNPGVVTLAHMSGAVASGRFINLSTSATATKLLGAGNSPIGGSAVYEWNGSYWLLMAHEQGGPISLGLAGGNFVGVSPTEIRTQFWYLHGRDLHVSIYLVGTVPAQVADLRIVGFPWTFSQPWPVLPAIGSVPTLWSPALVTADTGSSLALYPVNVAAWPAGTVYLCFDLTIPIS